MKNKEIKFLVFIGFLYIQLTSCVSPKSLDKRPNRDNTIISDGAKNPPASAGEEFDLGAPLRKIYVDQTLNLDCIGNYSIQNRNCNGLDGDAYRLIQTAINESQLGDVIYMRGGTYNNISINIPLSKNGTSWNSGGYTMLRSYPGEWAVIDATALAPVVDQTLSAVIYGYTGFDKGSDSKYTEYWAFSHFEIMGGGSGVHMKMRNVKWYYMYIHDNGRAGVSDLQSGILSVNPQYSEIKYCYFKDNINEAAPNLNQAHILFDADYRDDSSNGGLGQPFLINGATHHNEIAYNIFELTGANVGAAHIAIRQKNQQRFGLNNRNPLDMTYSEYGDKIHHNIVLGSEESIGVGQDFIQVYNNITDSSINIGRSGDVPITYNAVVYNNTVQSPRSAAFMSSSGLSTYGNTADLNYYDSLPQQTVHTHISFYNNIADGNINSYHNVPFFLHWDMPANTTNPNQDNSDLVLENNYIHNNTNTSELDVIVGHNFDTGLFTGCDLQNKTIEDFNNCSKIWRSVASVENWSGNNSGLYLGVSGADQYITDESFVVGNSTIANGGKGGCHPYFGNGALPSYIGATNPNGNEWVAGILENVSKSSWLKNQDLVHPTWVEPIDSSCF